MTEDMLALFASITFVFIAALVLGWLVIPALVAMVQRTYRKGSGR